MGLEGCAIGHSANESSSNANQDVMIVIQGVAGKACRWAESELDTSSKPRAKLMSKMRQMQIGCISENVAQKRQVLAHTISNSGHGLVLIAVCLLQSKEYIRLRPVREHFANDRRLVAI